jgi:hypothetical protein
MFNVCQSKLEISLDTMSLPLDLVISSPSEERYITNGDRCNEMHKMATLS